MQHTYDPDTTRCRCGAMWVWHEALAQHGCEASPPPPQAADDEPDLPVFRPDELVGNADWPKRTPDRLSDLAPRRPR